MPDEQHHRLFKAFFHAAVGQDPFAFQGRCAHELPSLTHVPTGLGKTAMAVVGWLWRRFGAGDEVRRQTPRRLVYCLPMRVLVEQTRDNAAKWVGGLRKAGCLQRDVPVHILMGGEGEDDWDSRPEREAIIIGTQDMLLSRALNRGYAASRSRWPMQFGLLHTDCLWVFDEIQLMGAGLATTAQLEAFRYLLGSQDGHGCRSVWMSATLDRKWLETVDFKDRVGNLVALELDAEDHDNEEVEKRWAAKKPLAKSSATMGDAAGLADEVRKAHKAGTRTIVVINTVRRACELFEALNNGTTGVADAGQKTASRKKGLPKAAESAATDTPKFRIVLLHSRFRLADRERRVDEALAEIKAGEPGTIIISTQVIEAGVDVSATTLFTELGPWASLVQRFGRCNRRGGENDSAAVHWIAMPTKNADAERVVAPYQLDDLNAAAEQLKKLKDVGLKSLPEVELHFEHGHVIRRKDLIDLFDTTADLAGNDIDIDRFVREIEDSDVRMFWRAWDRPKGHEPPPKDEPAPRREELCPSPVSEFRDFATRHRGQVWQWNFLDKTWEKADAARIAPGQVFLVHADAGGYSAERGWNPASTTCVEPMAPPTGAKGETPDATDDDRLSRVSVWQTIAEHTDEVCKELDAIVAALPLASGEANALRRAARCHDRGKAHEVFVRALPDGAPDTAQVWVKAPGKWKRYGRPHFRHELASALAVLLESDGLTPLDVRDLVAYLIAAHHGKVRLSIRSLPNEMRPDGNRRFARGVWDGDTLPATDLGGAIIAPAVVLSLEPMELGLCEQPPFAGQPSWAERMIRLRDTLGPFRFAYLEAILRAADMRASAAAERRAAQRQTDAEPSSSSAGGAGKEAPRA